uniref:Protein UPSTREAM OF FLC-like isoform X1 n=1 Tax=Rhizophora mucronata TaxID=61149 RepID=A0A2P2KM03_RHIMU
MLKMQNLKQFPEQVSSRSHRDESSSSSSLNGTKHTQEDELSPPVQRPGSCGMSVSLPTESGDGKSSSWNGSLSLTEYKVYKSDGLAHASTQTEEIASRPRSRETCTRGVSTDDCLLECEPNLESQVPHAKENSVISENFLSPPPSTSSASSSGGKTETLESLIRADVNKINSFRILEEEEIRTPPNMRLKATNLLMQLISCGSISVKDHSFGLIPTYKPSFNHSKFHSPLFSTSMMLGELDRFSDNPRVMGMRLEDKEYFSGSLIETKLLKEEGNGLVSLKRSSSYNADRTSKELDIAEDNDESAFGPSKCIPRKIMASISRQPRSESMRSPISHNPRNSSDGGDGSYSICSSASNGGSKRITEPSKKQSRKLDSFREENEGEKVIKIEES